MWGLLFFGVIGIGCFINSCKTDYENTKRREQSKQNGGETYFDYNGKCRLVSNNHQIDRTLRVVNGELDHVLIDTKTEKILHNYSEDKRIAERQKAYEKSVKDSEERRQAREEGRYFYAATGESRIINGFYEDSPVNYLIHHYRRVGDNLLLHKDCREGEPIREARCEFYIWAGRAEERKDMKVLRELAARNWWKLLKWDKEREWWKEKGYYPTKAEAEEYARSLDAYMPDTIRDGKPLLICETTQEVLDCINKYKSKIDENNLSFFINRIQAELVYDGYLIRKDEVKKLLS